MKDRNTIHSFEKFLGKSISDIKYIETKFHYDISGNWTNVNTDDFVLHSPEWEITFSNGEKWFVTNPFDNSDRLAIPNMLKLESFSIAKPDDKIHKVPYEFGWKDILGQEIRGIRFYNVTIKTKKLFGFSSSKKYKHIQIIEFFYTNHSFCITAMNGDIGHSNFYPTGVLSGKVGFFFNKTIVDNITVLGITKIANLIHQTSVKK
ncbi:hypothetical protein [Sporocytophaga myxococcoides]|uniref:hypothetical protein n=1 Tax=Sporocytophaga myxococcoides TaxID=153721 RepID=UPI00041F792A|nr:hypothetical protein [Sporocytophaga myxococcoides]